MTLSVRALSVWLLLVALGVPMRSDARHLSPLGVQEFRETLVAPLFSLPSLSDRPVSLAEFRGSFALLNFWATWCPPCVAEMPDLEKLHRELKEHGFVVVAISIDAGGKKSVAPFWEKKGLTFPSLLDASGEVATKYGVRSLPASFLINPRGEIIGRILGPRDWHSEQARAVFRTLLSGTNSPGGPR